MQLDSLVGRMGFGKKKHEDGRGQEQNSACKAERS